MSQRFAALFYSGDEIINHCFASNYQEAMNTLLTYLEDAGPSTWGKIVDTLTGNVLFQGQRH